MLHDIAADTKAMCRVCMTPDLEHATNLYGASPSGLLPSLYDMLKAICTPVFTKSEPDVLMPEKPTKVCLVCQNAVEAAYNLHQQCIETDRRLGELVALKWELQGGDEVVDPVTSGSQEETLSMSAEIKNEIPEQRCKPTKSRNNKTCQECGKTFATRRNLIRHVRQGFCDMTNDPKQRTCEICNKVLNSIQLLKRHREMHDSIDRAKQIDSDESIPAADLLTTTQEHTSEKVRLVHDNPLLNIDEVDVIKQEPLDLMDENDNEDSLLEREVEIAYARNKEEQNPEELDQIQEEEDCAKEETNETLVVEMPAPEENTLTKVTKEIDVQCTDCGVTFLSIRAHKTHTQEGNCKQKPTYPCELCEKIFDKPSRRRYHYYTHTKRFPCSMCNELFRSNSSLLKHRCSAMGSSQTSKEDGINEPLTEQPLVQGETSSEELEMIKVEEPEIEDVEMKMESEIYEERKPVTGVTKTCKICSKTFDRIDTMQLHMKKHHQLHMCGKCHEIFETEQMLEDHKMVSHAAVTVTCPKCDQSFESTSALRMHKRYGNCLQEPDQTPKSFACDLCEKTFESAVKLGYHKANHDSQNYCQQCRFCFGSKRKLQVHIAKGKCLGDIVRTCRVCKTVFETVAAHKKHRREAHPGPVDCPDCGRTQANLNMFRVHIKEGRCKSIQNGSIKEVVPFTCKICGVFQTSSSQLKTHMKEKHLDQIYYCSPCYLHFPTQEKFDAHMEKHEKNMVNICQTCNTSFPTRAELKRHKFTHSSPAKCTVCDKSFVRYTDLKAHMTIHTGEKAHACELVNCDMRFRTAIEKRHHMRTHSNKPYVPLCVCDQCGSKFTSKHTLKTHIMTYHEGIRPYACSLCDLKFGKPQILKRHMLTHTKEKPYKCAICPQAYAQSANLVRHVARDHDGDGKAYACDRCDKSFRFIAELREHYAEHVQAGDDSTTEGKKVRFTSVSLLNKRFAKETKKQRTEEGGDLE